MNLLISILAGGGIGALLGHFGQCSSGQCPLTANWKRGTIYGAVIGLVFHLASGGAYPHPKNIQSVSEANFTQQVTQAGKPVVVDFFATWCGPCKTLAPQLDKLAGEFSDHIRFVSVNIDMAPKLAAQYNVEGVPTVLFFNREGKVIDSSLGLPSIDALRAKLELLAKGELR